MNTKINQKGFTIVELLIVIVVIAILAAISIVAYNGIQNRGKASSGQSTASQVAKKAEAYNTVQSTYPTALANFATVPESTLDNTGSVSFGTEINATTANGGQVVSYMGARSTGACVGWWDYAATTQGVKYITVGAGDAGTLC
jgi:prepilin-type N-terminal cleavage/methylation domain-containing protein